MKNMTLGDLKISLADLLERRRSDLLLSTSGTLYLPLLTKKREAVDALPETVTGGRANADTLATADMLHDGLGGAIWHFAEAVQRCPLIDGNLKKAAERVRTAFIPELSELQRTYADEARVAHDRRQLLDVHTEDLKALAVPGGGTLFDWVGKFLDAGDNLGSLLSKRADTEATAPSGKGAAKLRATTIGLLGRLRGAIGDELDTGGTLPADYEARIFAHIDNLAQERTEAERRRVARSEAAKVAPHAATTTTTPTGATASTAPTAPTAAKEPEHIT
ncbi:MAG: hypothetical protein WCI05_08960 [Myxococcales bacterium]